MGNFLNLNWEQNILAIENGPIFPGKNTNSVMSGTGAEPAVVEAAGQSPEGGQ